LVNFKRAKVILERILARDLNLPPLAFDMEGLNKDAIKVGLLDNQETKDQKLILKDLYEKVTLT
jgi:hypothetical protein